MFELKHETFNRKVTAQTSGVKFSPYRVPGLGRKPSHDAATDSIGRCLENLQPAPLRGGHQGKPVVVGKPCIEGGKHRGEGKVPPRTGPRPQEQRRGGNRQREIAA